jgi:hypothetical protein
MATLAAGAPATGWMRGRVCRSTLPASGTGVRVGSCPHRHAIEKTRCQRTSMQPNRIDEQIANNREQARDQCAGDGNAGVHHPLEDLINYVLLGDVAGQRIADALDVVLDGGELGLLVVDHRADAVDACGVPSGQLRIALISEMAFCSAWMAAVWSSGVMAMNSGRCCAMGKPARTRVCGGGGATGALSASRRCR